MAIEEVLRALTRPEQREQSIHQRRMQHRDAGSRNSLDNVNQLAIERRDLHLFRRAALSGPPSEVGRVDVIPNLDVPIGDAAVPRRNAPT